MSNRKEQELVIDYILEAAKKYDLRSEVHEFPSGAVMLDVWKLPDLLVVQLYDNIIGFSVVNEENPDFSTVPDELFPDFESFKKRLDNMLQLDK